MLRNTPRSPIFISNALLCGKCRHNRGSTVRAVSNGWVSTADRIAVSVIKFDGQLELHIVQLRTD